MKEYTAPTLKGFSFETKDAVTASATVNSIVSESDRSTAQKIQVTEWNDTWD